MIPRPRGTGGRNPPACTAAALARRLSTSKRNAVSRLRLEEEEDEIDTLGGLVVKLVGRVPLRGEVIPHPGRHEFVVLEADPRRIRMLRVTLRASDPKGGAISKASA